VRSPLWLGTITNRPRFVRRCSPAPTTTFHHVRMPGAC
jgi:hypothetical protein